MILRLLCRFCQEFVNIYNLHTFDSILPGIGLETNPRADKYEQKCVQIVKLLMAASQGDLLALKRAYFSGMDMDAADYDNRTALHLACSEGHLDCVKFLVEICKVDIDVKDRLQLSIHPFRIVNH